MSQWVDSDRHLLLREGVGEKMDQRVVVVVAPPRDCRASMDFLRVGVVPKSGCPLRLRRCPVLARSGLTKHKDTLVPVLKRDDRSNAGKRIE